MTSDFDFRNRTFVLRENDAGHAAADTSMEFDERTRPFAARYQGANNPYGQALVTQSASGEFEMVYHALSDTGELTAGAAKVEVVADSDGVVMTLHWRWLTGDQTQGVSVWDLLDRS